MAFVKVILNKDIKCLKFVYGWVLIWQFISTPLPLLHLKKDSNISVNLLNVKVLIEFLIELHRFIFPIKWEV